MPKKKKYPIIASYYPCPVCDKEGRVNGRKCPICKGKGALRVSTDSGMELLDDFWDCECDSGYIHHRDETVCLRCLAERDEQPNTRLNELLGTVQPLIEKVRKMEAARV